MSHIKSSQSASALKRWEPVILGWLSDPSQAYAFSTNYTVSACHFALREAINGHIKYRHDSPIDPDVLKAAWDNAKLSVQPDGTHQIAPRVIHAATSGKHISVVATQASNKANTIFVPNVNQQNKFVISTDNLQILEACTLLANAGVFASNNVIVEVKTNEHGSEFLQSLPNDTYPNVATDQPDPSINTHYLL